MINVFSIPSEALGAAGGTHMSEAHVKNRVGYSFPLSICTKKLVNRNWAHFLITNCKLLFYRIP